MVRMNMLRNSPVICHDRQIGLLQSISFDEAQKVVHALIVAGGLKGKCVVPAKDVLTLSREFILVGSSAKYNRSNENPPLRFARDTTGSLIGRVTDYLIDEKTLCVVSLEIMRGYMPSERHARIWTFSYCASVRSQDEAVVAVSFCDEPPEEREEACTCVFQP